MDGSASSGAVVHFSSVFYVGQLMQVNFITETKKGTLIQISGEIEYRDGRILFLKSPFALKEEIKAMEGSKWHGNDDPPRKMWSVKDTPRNRFQLDYLMGKDTYAWFDREIIRHAYSRPLMDHQRELADHFLTYHYGIMAAEMGCVDGEAVIKAAVADRVFAEFTTTLSQLTSLMAAEPEKDYYVESWDGAAIVYNRVIKAIDKGVKRTVKVVAGHLSTCVTPDHEFFDVSGKTVSALDLETGQQLLAKLGPVAVESVTTDTPCRVYDLVMQDPHRNFVADGFVVHNCGKTLSAQEVMEQSGVKDWWWVGPKSSLPNIERELRKWNLDSSIRVKMLTYERLVREMKENAEIPQGVIFDESSRVKTSGALRTQAAQNLADAIRAKYGNDGYVILMSGTPSPKTPVDWYSQCEIAYPGFLKEGSPKALERRLAFLELKQFDGGVSFNDRVGWRDDEKKCDVCGMFEQDGPHTHEDGDYHRFVPSRNEVAYMYERLKGLVIIKHKKDCLTLPEKHYRKIVCQPSASVLRVAKAIVQSSPSAVQAMMLLRELSDGFQYREKVDGTAKCTHCKDGKVYEWFTGEEIYSQIDMLTPEKVATLERREVDCPVCGGSGQMPKIIRETKEIPCPKENALKDLLDECEDTGRIVVFAGFTGSVDRVTNLCRKQGWDVVRLDGRGYQVTRADGQPVEEQGLDYWANRDNLKVAFVAHPESGGMSLTLTEASMAVYWSNSLKPEYRIQSEDRIHRIGADFNRGCTIVDLTHLPSDERVLDIIQSNRKLELMTMGEAFNGINWGDVYPAFSATA